MLSLLFSNPILVLLTLPVLMLSLTLHEVAHGYAAYKCGDSTAHDMGRLTLNPLKHLDLMGAICMLVIGFGWAKPVPVNTRNFKKPKRDMALVAAAGPAANLLLCIVSLALYFVFLAVFSMARNVDGIAYFRELLDYLPSNPMYYDHLTMFADLGTTQSLVLEMLSLSAMLNANLMLFNLIPVPPLDGSRILAGILPGKLAAKYIRLERYVRYLILAICIINLASSYLPFLSVISEYIFYPLEYLRDGLLAVLQKLMLLIFGR